MARTTATGINLGNVLPSHFWPNHAVFFVMSPVALITNPIHYNFQLCEFHSCLIHALIFDAPSVLLYKIDSKPQGEPTIDTASVPVQHVPMSQVLGPPNLLTVIYNFTARNASMGNVEFKQVY